MKTIEQLDREITTACAACPPLKDNPTQFKKQSKNIRRLRLLRIYLENYPSQEHIEAQIDRLTRKINFLNQGYQRWLNSTPGVKDLRNAKTIYNKEMGITAAKAQIRNLKDLL
jgi:hypothetical protein